jgi:hypothetical protein
MNATVGYAGQPPSRDGSGEHHGQHHNHHHREHRSAEQFIKQCGLAGMAYEPIPVHTFMPVEQDLVNADFESEYSQLKFFYFKNFQKIT